MPTASQRVADFVDSRENRIIRRERRNDSSAEM